MQAIEIQSLATKLIFEKMKITKETRNCFNEDGKVAIHMLKDKTQNKNAKHSFLDIKKVALVLKEFQRIKNLNRDLSCGTVDVFKMNRNKSLWINISFNIYLSTLHTFCSVYAKRDSVEQTVQYSEKTNNFIEDCNGLRFLFNSFCNFALKVDNIKPKSIFSKLEINKENVFLSFICK